VIPGIPGASGQVGPPLAGIGGRSYIAGVLVNTPEDMIRWIVNPRAVDSLTAMPALGVTAAEARDIAAYLYRSR
jgi:cytochrome c1